MHWLGAGATQNIQLSLKSACTAAQELKDGDYWEKALQILPVRIELIIFYGFLVINMKRTKPA